MFKFKGISSTDMQVVIGEEEHFIARAAQRYETIEIEGRNGAIFNELGYSYVERPIYVQCLNINKIDQILAWLNGEGEFEYKGRKTIARFYSQLDPQRDTCIRIIDTTFIRDPFWNKVNEEYQTIKESKIKNANGNPIHISDSSNMLLSYRLNGGDRQESRSDSNLYNLNDTQSVSSLGVEVDEDDFITLSSDNTEGTSTQFINYFTAKNEKLKANTKYYGVLEVKAVSGVGTFYVTDQLGNQPQTQSKIAYNLNNITNGSKYKFNFTTLEDFTDCICMFRTFLKLDAGQSGSITFRLSVFESDPDLDTFEYEKYGVMPSPDYPSEVETVGSNVNILNIVDIDETENKGIKYSVKNGILKLSGTATAGLQIDLGSNVTIKKGTYTHSCDYIQQGLFISFDNLHANVLDESNPQKTFSLTEDTVYSKYFLWINQGTILNAVEIKLKLEPGEKATPYSPYGMGSVEIENVNKNFIKFPETDKTENRIRYIYK